MKHSDMFVKNGVVFNQITDIMSKAITARQKKVLVICDGGVDNENEIFDEASVTLYNRYPDALGIVTKPNPGVRVSKRNSNIVINYTRDHLRIELDLLTKSEYEKNKAAIDAKVYDSKHTIMFTGGEN